jgi:hypothetical protein
VFEHIVAFFVTFSYSLSLVSFDLDSILVLGHHESKENMHLILGFVSFLQVLE